MFITGYNPHYMEMAEKLSSLSGTQVITTLQIRAICKRCARHWKVREFSGQMVQFNPEVL